MRGEDGEGANVVRVHATGKGLDPAGGRGAHEEGRFGGELRLGGGGFRGFDLRELDDFLVNAGGVDGGSFL